MTELKGEKQEHGAQVVLDGPARAAARGAVGSTITENVLAKRALEVSGEVADGFSADGTSVTGKRQADDVLAEKTDTPNGPKADVTAEPGNTAFEADGAQGTTVTPTPVGRRKPQ